jgi:chemotaxis signal transduction protein
MHVVTVDIEGIQLGLDVKEVREVWRVSDVLAVPKASQMIIGLINRRGAVVTLVHGHRVIDVATTEDHPLGREYEVLILDHGGEQVAVAVSRLVDTIEVDPSQLLPIPPKLHTGVQRIALGVHPGQEQFTVIVSAEKIFECVRESAHDVTRAASVKP